mgnify:CR=1 FL=1
MNPLIANETLPNNIMLLQMEGKLSIHTKFTKPNQEYTNTKPRNLKKLFETTHRISTGNFFFST